MKLRGPEGDRYTGRWPGLIFDWALPRLENKVGEGGGSHFWILACLRECLAFVDAVTLAQYAGVTLDHLHRLLALEDLPPALLPPLLQILLQVAACLFSFLFPLVSSFLL